MKKFQATSDLIGKYINQHLYSDTNPVGKIIAVRGKTFVTIQPIVAGPNKVKMEFSTGGFAAHCTNQDEQQYDFFEEGEPYEIRLSATQMKRLHMAISDRPIKRYDYNF